MWIRWSAPASGDYDHIEAFYLERAPVEVVERNLSRILESVRQLRHFPNMGHPGRHRETREFTVPDSPFTLVYRIDGDAITVLRVIHGARYRP